MAPSRVSSIGAAALALACSGAEPTDAGVEVAPGGYVVIDAPAREAGWSLHVGGWCLPIGADVPVEVPEREWALVVRAEEGRHDVQLLHPTPGLLLSLSGAELDVEVVEIGEPLELAQPDLDDDDAE